ncbi:Flp family type IVb pilin [Lampropedia aestuarii]|uniref:Flp family type IVb pilin n=1 Tax=Lampropedia aestuarii TaxID=2562762 RepID=A0A4S5BTI1_9BURK|nr:Flp family type IVb pilin [Lampropedia aestuarii]THJ34583.1 Flp family type IVb pilin [Lampropedia aestuarii]
MTNIIKKFWKDEEGATAIEYGLIAGLIAVGILAAVTDIGTYLKVIFEKISEGLQTPGTP